mmetsp:Transcript_60966/g.137866  ORF Transcript_60966/g.137866 Transcript_60966/m.137866 type:complete len:470 (+) Transcript_60966:256-1665(+)
MSRKNTTLQQLFGKVENKTEPSNKPHGHSLPVPPSAKLSRQAASVKVGEIAPKFLPPPNTAPSPIHNERMAPTVNSFMETLMAVRHAKVITHASILKIEPGGLERMGDLQSASSFHAEALASDHKNQSPLVSGKVVIDVVLANTISCGGCSLSHEGKLGIEEKERRQIAAILPAGFLNDVVVELTHEIFNTVRRLHTTVLAERPSRSSLGHLGGDERIDIKFPNALLFLSRALHAFFWTLDTARSVEETAVAESLLEIEPAEGGAQGSPCRDHGDHELSFSSEKVLSRRFLWVSDVKQILLELKGTSVVLKSIEQVLEKYDVSSKVVAPTDAPINLVSNLVERIDLRIRTLGAWVELVETAKHSRIRAMKRRSTFEYLKEERLQEAEKECQQMLPELAVISQQCHRSGELSKQPILRLDPTALTTPRRTSRPASTGWRKRFFFLDYESLTYSHKLPSQGNSHFYLKQSL